MSGFETGLKLGAVYLALKKRHKRREVRRQKNINMGLIDSEIRKGSLHSDLNIAIAIIERLIKEMDNVVG